MVLVTVGRPDKTMADARVIRANGVDLCIQTFGFATDPVLLLIGGAGASMSTCANN